MLTGHEEGSEHMGNLPVGYDAPVLILLSTESGHHVAFILRESKEEVVVSEDKETDHPVLGLALLDYINVEVAHSLLSSIATAVTG